MILDFLKDSTNLKTISRQGWIDKLSIKNPESVADHSYSMAIMAMIISDLENYDSEKRKKIFPTGFSIGNNKLYLSNTNGTLIVVNLISGKVLKSEKISRNLISKPHIYKGNLYIVKNGSIIQYD